MTKLQNDNASKLGRDAYEADLAKTPRYHDGAPRKTWEQLREVEQWSWTRPVLEVTVCNP